MIISVDIVLNFNNQNFNKYCLYYTTKRINDMIQGKNTVRSAAQDFLEIKGYTEVLHWISKDSIYEKFATTCRSSPQSYIFSPVVKWEKL